MPKLHMLESRLRKLEASMFERKVVLRLDTGNEYLTWSEMKKGCIDSLVGIHSREAYAIEHCKSADDEWTGRWIDMLKAVLQGGESP